MAVLQTDMQVLKERVGKIEEAIPFMRSDIAQLKIDIAQMQNDITDIKGRLENNAIKEEEFIALKYRVAYLENLVLKPSVT